MRSMYKMNFQFLLTLIFAVMVIAMDPEGELIREEWDIVSTNDEGLKKNNTIIFEVPVEEIKIDQVNVNNTHLNNSSDVALVIESVPENNMGMVLVPETKPNTNGQANTNKTQEAKSPNNTTELKKIEHQVVEAEFDLLRNQVADSSIKVPKKDDKVAGIKGKDDKKELKSLFSSKIRSEDKNEFTANKSNPFKFQPLRHFPNPFVSLFRNLRQKFPLKSSTVKPQNSKVKSFSSESSFSDLSPAFGYGPYDSFDTKTESKKFPIKSKLQKQSMFMPESRFVNSKLMPSTTTKRPEKPISSDLFASVELIPESVFFNRKRSDSQPSQFTVSSISLPDKDSAPPSLESILFPRQPVNYPTWSKQLDVVDFGPQPSRSGSTSFPSGLSDVLGSVFSNIKKILGQPNRNEASKNSIFGDLSPEDNDQKERITQHIKDDLDLLEKDLYSITEMGRRSEDLLAHIKRVVAQLQSSQDNNQKLAGSFSNVDTFAQPALDLSKPGMTAEVEIVLEPALEIRPEENNEETFPFKSIKPSSFTSVGKASSSPLANIIKDLLSGSRSKSQDVPLIETIVV